MPAKTPAAASRPGAHAPLAGAMPSIALDTVAGWVEAAGTPRLAQRLLAGLQAHVPASFVFVFLAPVEAPVSLVSGASLHGQAARRAADSYLAQGFERFDVNTRLLRARRVHKRRQTMVTLQTAEAIADADYRRACYDEPGVHSRASVVVALPDGARHATVNLYRTHALAAFAPAELALLARYAPLLGALVAQHVRLLDRPAGPGDRAAALAERLSARERMVIDAIMRGLTTKMLARQTGLAETTLNTYRYRAFRRLGIRREKELFALLQPAPAA